MNAKTAKPTGAAVAYYRVSTQKQGASGLGLDAQKAAVEAYAAQHGLAISASFTEVETGTRKRRRVEIYKAIEAAKASGATLLIAKLDRLARNVHFISGLMESGVKFVAVDMPQVTPLTLHVLAAVAEQEATLISQRTKAALAQAKKRGVKLGTPDNLTHAAQAKGANANRVKAKGAYSQVLNYARMLRSQGDSFGSIAKRLNEDGYRTRAGKTFAPMTVHRMLKRNHD